MSVHYSDDSVTLHLGDSLDVLRTFPDQSVDCCVTSPPYFGLRDYGTEGQYGLESSPAEYVETMRALFAEVRRVLADDGTLWLNIGDSYSSTPPGRTDNAVRSSTLTSTTARRSTGANSQMRESVRRASVDRTRFLPTKNLMGIPWRTAFALQDDGWILRNDIIWNKPNAMPESVADRLSARHEHVFMLTKSRRYWFDLDPIREPLAYPERITGHMFGGANKAAQLNQGSARTRTGSTYDKAPEGGRNPGDVWTMATQPFSEAHFAVMPVALAERAIQAGCKPGGTVLDPFSGSGTTGLAAARHGRRYVGIDLSAEYLDLSLRTRLAQTSLLDGEASA
ncbi:MAG: site-specific DNA-methyltransferase [Hyphomicrobiales bacterium]|nr:MAG: site-specific DNA-methyltransferase [Hyphomicrobiales bacterium]